MSDSRKYVQRLTGLDLTIERATNRTPDRSRYHVYLGNEILGSYGRLSDAQSHFREVRDESGWKPPEPKVLEPEERLRRETEARERSKQAEHWHRVRSRRGWFKGHRV